MTISALNRWRKAYLAEMVVAASLGPARAALRGRGEARGLERRGVYQQFLRFTLIAGASLWLMHDMAHGRWRIAVADLVVLAACLKEAPLLALPAVGYAAANAERPPSPFVWSRWRANARTA